MSRPLRIERAGGLYHVTSRGDRREAIYLNDSDRLAWLDLFAEVCERFNWVCHGWCQMSNHYHMVIETPEPNLSRGMRQLNGVYTQYINRTYERVGHVFQGRYKAIVVDKEGYLLELSRYVVLNPVRAGMVADAGQWRWSSYAAMMAQVPPPTWLNTESVLAYFGADRARARRLFGDFVRAGVGLPSVWDDLRGQIFLGDDAFLVQMQSCASTTEHEREIPRAQQRPLAKPILDYKDDVTNKHQAMVAAYASGNYTMQAISEAFGVHYATVSRAVRKQQNSCKNV